MSTFYIPQRRPQKVIVWGIKFKGKFQLGNWEFKGNVLISRSFRKFFLKKCDQNPGPKRRGKDFQQIRRKIKSPCEK